jgi:hypothetical protein
MKIPLPWRGGRQSLTGWLSFFAISPKKFYNSNRPIHPPKGNLIPPKIKKTTNTPSMNTINSPEYMDRYTTFRQ